MKISGLTLSRRSRYHIETSPLICFANQWTGFYMISASVVKELMVFLETCELIKMCEKVSEKVSEKVLEQG